MKFDFKGFLVIFSIFALCYIFWIRDFIFHQYSNAQIPYHLLPSVLDFGSTTWNFTYGTNWDKSFYKEGPLTGDELFFHKAFYDLRDPAGPRIRLLVTATCAGRGGKIDISIDGKKLGIEWNKCTNSVGCPNKESCPYWHYDIASKVYNGQIPKMLRESSKRMVDPNYGVHYVSDNLDTQHCTFWSKSKYTYIGDVDEMLYIRNRTKLFDFLESWDKKKKDLGGLIFPHVALTFDPPTVPRPYNYEQFIKLDGLKHPKVFDSWRFPKSIFLTQYIRIAWVHYPREHFGKRESHKVPPEEALYLHAREDFDKEPNVTQIHFDVRLFDEENVDKKVDSIRATIFEIFDGEIPEYKTHQVYSQIYACKKKGSLRKKGCSEPGVSCFQAIHKLDDWIYTEPTEESNYVVTVIRDSNAVEIPVHRSPKNYTNSLSACIGAVHWFNDWPRLIVFLEVWRRQGTEKFLFTVQSVSKTVKQVLDFYEKKGLLQIHDWPLLPFSQLYDPNYRVYYISDNLETQHCLFWSDSKYTFQGDVDDFLYIRNSSLPFFDYFETWFQEKKDLGALSFPHVGLAFRPRIIEKPYKYENVLRFDALRKPLTFEEWRMPKTVFLTEYVKNNWVHHPKAYFADKRRYDVAKAQAIHLHGRMNFDQKSDLNLIKPPYPDVHFFKEKDLEKTLKEIGGIVREIFGDVTPEYRGFEVQTALQLCRDKGRPKKTGCLDPGVSCFDELFPLDDWWKYFGGKKLYNVPLKEGLHLHARMNFDFEGIKDETPTPYPDVRFFEEKKMDSILEEIGGIAREIFGNETPEYRGFEVYNVSILTTALAVYCTAKNDRLALNIRLFATVENANKFIFLVLIQTGTLCGVIK
ncbi:unnamed protein product, partial [Mesorhabditis belari]|uniref:Glycosyltransferase family 92 protein n=1 Tax=Mesorhabditis belari TaxID=2138241 RepID=A0AAF3F7H7_9BILA